MARKLRIAAIAVSTVAALLAALVGSAYYATRQVRPFYRQALQIQPEVLERGGRELESRASALYSDAQQEGYWEALFTAEQINGWLATQLDEHQTPELRESFRDWRVAIASDALTVGVRTTSGGVETVLSVSASVSLTDEGAIAVTFLSVRAGTLPLPAMSIAEQIADVCRNSKLPVRWKQQDGKPVALIEVDSQESKHEFQIESIALGENEVYVAGRTKPASLKDKRVAKKDRRHAAGRCSFALDDFELRLTPTDERSALEIARRQESADKKATNAAGR
jgi:hypothetical protein